MSRVLSFSGISKKFAKIDILRDINLEIEDGEIFGLIGLNGAGKTTLLRCLLGLARVDKGLIRFKGKILADKDIQAAFGFLPENFLPPYNLKGEELLTLLSWGGDYFANNTCHKPPSYESSAVYLLKSVGLGNDGGKYIKTYSRGMIQRLGLACALLKNPKIIVLDEPTLGLDPVGQKQVFDLLADFNKQGKTIFFSSHILSQIEKNCSRIGILHAGQIKFVGTAEGIKSKHNVSHLEEAFLKEIGL
ncbi:MAG: ABC transporter ATP-binding protein [Candidatus Omnitrophota bacterium]